MLGALLGPFNVAVAQELPTDNIKPIQYILILNGVGIAILGIGVIVVGIKLKKMHLKIHEVESNKHQ